MAEPRAFYRSYVDKGRHAGQVKRLHVLREDGKMPGRQGWCGTHAWDVTNSRTVVLNAIPYVPPDGLTWCGSCVVALARRVLRLAEPINVFPAEPIADSPSPQRVERTP